MHSGKHFISVVALVLLIAGIAVGANPLYKATDLSKGETITVLFISLAVIMGILQFFLFRKDWRIFIGWLITGLISLSLSAPGATFFLLLGLYILMLVITHKLVLGRDEAERKRKLKERDRVRRGPESD